MSNKVCVSNCDKAGNLLKLEIIGKQREEPGFPFRYWLMKHIFFLFLKDF